MVWNQGRASSPWRALERFQQEIDRMFTTAPRSAFLDTQFPRVNVARSDDGLFLSVELPGFSTEDVEVEVHEDRLTLSGKRTSEGTSETPDLRREFSRSFELPFRVESEDVKATLRNGVLELTLPRAASDRPRQIPVHVG